MNFWESIVSPTPMHGPWRKISTCHCGQLRQRHFPLSGDWDVCPNCGHSDKWSTRVARWEWDSGFMGLRQNERWVDWTPEHCPIKGDE